MLSDNKRLDFLIRKNRGRHKLDAYKLFFQGFNLNELMYIELEESDEILNRVRNIFPPLETVSEMIEDAASKTSLIIQELKKSISTDDFCYVFSDDVRECGMFKTTANSALDSCLEIAFKAYDNTCFIVDGNFEYCFTINYNDLNDRDYPDTFDIQNKRVRDI